MTGEGSLGTPHRSGGMNSQIQRDASPTYSTMGKNTHGVSVGYRETSVINQSMGMGVNKADKNKTNVFGKSPPKRMDQTPTNFDRDASGFDRAIGVEKKITSTSNQHHSKVHSDTANALQNRSKSNINVPRDQSMKITETNLGKLISMLPSQAEIAEK